MSGAPATWPAAAADLARRATRRERWSAALRPLGLVGLCGAAVALVLVATRGLSPEARGAWVAAGLGVGLLLGLRDAARVHPTDRADAAWALDRIGGAGGRGLVAAVVTGPAGAEAAWAAPAIAVPRVRLRPPEGISLAAGALLLSAVALLVPADAGASDARGAPRDGAASRGGASGAGGEAGEPQAQAASVRAQDAERVRDALGLTPEEAADPEAVREHLREPDARRRAGEAAAGTDLAELVDDRSASAEDLAHALVLGERSAQEAQRLRRDAAAARAEEEVAPVPPERRALLERYFAAGAAEGGER